MRSLPADPTFDAFFRAEHGRVVASVAALFGDVALAEDAAAEAFARALDRWSSVAAMDSPRGWIHTVATNVARRHLRRRSVEHRLLRRRAPLPDVVAPAGPDPVWEAVAGLPPRQRQAIVLRHVADLREAEVAEVMGVGRSTVSRTLAAAHERLAEVLDDPAEPADRSTPGGRR